MYALHEKTSAAKILKPALRYNGFSKKINNNFMAHTPKRRTVDFQPSTMGA